MNKYVVRIERNDKCSPHKVSENRSFENREAANNYFAFLCEENECTTQDTRTGMFWARRFYGIKYYVELSIESI